METTQTFNIPGLKLLKPARFEDERGVFSETWNERRFAAEVAPVRFVQDNQSTSTRKGTIRGLHYQRAPFAQGKLVRVLRGAILDVVADLRPESPTFGKHRAILLNAVDGEVLYVPEGLLHGFCTLEDETTVFYKTTAYYAPAFDGGVRWNDPTLAIDWPVGEPEAILSAKDRALPFFAQLFGNPLTKKESILCES
jgi:dTDP-4-dehydrorhamnose 3,5-epimerase